MLHILVLVTLVLSAADHWTTWLCLRSPMAGWEVQELNPISDWLFQTIGLGSGLLLDSTVTVAALAFLVVTPRVPPAVKLGFLATVALATGYAVANNLGVMSKLGLPLASL